MLKFALQFALVVFFTVSTLGLAQDPPGPVLSTDALNALMRELEKSYQQPAQAVFNSLSEASRASQAGIVIVGSEQTGHGTAFVISKDNRLLATNAHVADLLYKGFPVQAMVNRTTKTYRVEKVYYHPGVRRMLRNALPVRSMNPQDGGVVTSSPDVAVLQLAAEGDPLEYELPLASWDEIKDLFAKEIAMIGYPGYDTRQMPKAGEKPVASVHNGMISRITDFALQPDGDESLAQMIQHTASSWSGFSGSPLILPNGHVVAIHNSAANETRGSYTTSLPYGIRVDALKELLVYHGLEKKVQMNVGSEPILVDRYKQPDQISQNYQRAVQLVDIAYAEMLDGQAKDAVEKCDEAMKLAPAYLSTYLVKWHAIKADTSLLGSEAKLDSQLKTIKKYNELAPWDARGLIFLAETQYRLLLLTDAKVPAGQRQMKPYNDLIDFLTGLTTKEGMSNEVKAHALARIAMIQDEPLAKSDVALQNMNLAVKLSGVDPLFLEMRANFYLRRGEFSNSIEDRANAKALRKFFPR